MLTTETGYVRIAIVAAVETQTRAASLPMSPDGLARAGVTEREREVLALLVVRLTNREIAERLGCSVRTVESHVSALLGKLGVHDRVTLAQIGPSLLRASSPAAHRLPKPMTSFVGRLRELAEVEELFALTPLVTLVGAPGIGKTRLAIEVALRRADAAVGQGADVVFCDLTPISEDAVVADMVLAALGGEPAPDRSPIEALAALARDRRALLILDNCEHVLAGAADVVRAVVGASDEVQVLATGREPLGLDGEVTYTVRPLGSRAAPSPARDEAIDVRDDATRLFRDRARAARPDFRPGKEEFAAIAAICRRLDGLPLAIELAAPLVRAYSPAQIEAALDDSLAALSSLGRSSASHHRSLRASLDWSHRLLTDGEQRLFARLSVFAGSAGLAAIEAICGDSPLRRREIVGLLASLVDRSLVEADTRPGTADRFRLLFPVRDYAREQAAASGELDELERRHAAFYADRADEAEANLIGPDAPAWVARIRLDVDDIRAALAWSHRSGERESGLRLIAALGPFWEEYDRRHEWIERAIGLVSTPEVTPTTTRARALVSASTLIEAWDPRTSIVFATEALALAEDLGDARTVARAKVELGTRLARSSGRAEGSRRLLESAREWFVGAGDRRGAAQALFGLGASEPTAAAMLVWARARDLFAATGDELSVANVLYLSGLRLVVEGIELDDAQTMLVEALERAARHGSEREAAHARSGLGHLGVRRGAADAAPLLRSAVPVFRMTGDVRCTARCDYLLGVLSLRSGAIAEARRAFRAAIEGAERVEDLRTLAEALDGLGATLPDGRDRAALTLHGAAARVREVGGIDPGASLLRDAAAIPVRRQRAAELADGAWAEGFAIAPADAARVALGVT